MCIRFIFLTRKNITWQNLGLRLFNVLPPSAKSDKFPFKKGLKGIHFILLTRKNITWQNLGLRLFNVLPSSAKSDKCPLKKGYLEMAS